MLSGREIDNETIVLIVEDDPSDMHVLMDVCLDAGFARVNIWPIADLQAAIGMLNHGVVDLVLLDLALDKTEDPTRAVALLEAWDHETRRKKIPVIVVTRLTEVVTRAATPHCFEVIPKPGPSDGEKVIFSKFLRRLILDAISRRSDEATFWDRIRQHFNRRVPDEVHIHGPGLSLKIKTPSIMLRAAVAIFVLACYVVAVFLFAKSQGWPIKVIAGSLGAVVVVFGAWAAIRKKYR